MYSRVEVYLSFAVLVGLGSCGPDYSPNTYSSVAVQQANKVEPGVIVGVRKVEVSASGVVGAATGAAAGGIAGAQTSGSAGSAIGALGGALVGGLVGTAVEHTAADTSAFEYIVRKPNGDLLSVTQRDTAALLVGQKVLLIDGKQARIVPDYTVPATPPADTTATTTPQPAPSAATSTVPATVAVQSSPLAPPPDATRATSAGAATPPLAAPVPPPPLTPGSPTPLAPP